PPSFRPCRRAKGGDRESVVAEDLVLHSAKQRGPWLRGIGQTALGAIDQVFPHPCRNRGPELMPPEAAYSVKIGRWIRRRRPRADDAEIIADDVRKKESDDRGAAESRQSAAFQVREVLAHRVEFGNI